MVYEFPSLVRRAILGDRTRMAVKAGWRSAKQVLSRPMGAAGLGIIVFFGIIAIFAPEIGGPFPNYADKINISTPNLGFNVPGFPFGTDAFGRNNWAMLVYGARASLIVGFIASIVSMVMGTLVGVTAGYFGGWLDRFLAMITDFFLVIPWLPFILILVLVLGQSFNTTILAIALVSWPTTARILRSETLTVKTRGYIRRARAIGSGDGHIVAHHVMPVLGPLIFANMILMVSNAIFAESFIAFFGLEDPNIASWGTMIQYTYINVDFVAGRWWAVLPPGICITALVLAFAMVSFVLEEIINPKLRAR